MTKEQVQALYTRKVSELIQSGHQIHPWTMGSLQGEIAHTDLCRGGEIVRVLMEEESGFRNGIDNLDRVLVIKVGRVVDTQKVVRKYHGEISYSTIWNDDLETIYELKLAIISSTFFTSLEEGRRIAEVRHQRWRARNKGKDEKELGDAYREIALRWLRKQPRMKTCKLEDVERVCKSEYRRRGEWKPCYNIYAKGKSFTLG